jgi:hypothetical protein
MSSDLIQARLAQYTINSIEDEEYILKEILQEVILYCLAKEDFFTIAAFQGGTALRILYKLPRFSEDLDFILKAPDSKFIWARYKKAIEEGCRLFGVDPDIIDKDTTDKTVKKMFLKDNSIGKIINLQFRHHAWKKLKIKLEIDTNPPEGSNFKINYVEFPVDYSILAQDLPSLFSGKCHALLCREYVKGRDWFDFLWYIQRKVTPNLTFLKNAINQQGPWSNQDISVSAFWLFDNLKQKIQRLDWEKVQADVLPFLRSDDVNRVSLWSKDFFLDKCEKLKEIMSD